jgi:hypothetical protein
VPPWYFPIEAPVKARRLVLSPERLVELREEEIRRYVADIRCKAIRRRADEKEAARRKALGLPEPKGKRRAPLTRDEQALSRFKAAMRAADTRRANRLAALAKSAPVPPAVPAPESGPERLAFLQALVASQVGA